MRIETDSDTLAGGGSRQAVLASALLEVCSGIAAAAGDAAGAVGDARASDAVSGAGEAWSRHLEGLAGSVHGLGTNLSAAADAYAGTDRRAMPERR